MTTTDAIELDRQTRLTPLVTRHKPTLVLKKNISAEASSLFGAISMTCTIGICGRCRTDHSSASEGRKTHSALT